MTGRARYARTAAAIVVALAALVALGSWWFIDRTTPDRVGPRFVRSLIARHPGTTVDRWAAGTMRTMLPSGVYVDVRLSAVFDACAARRFQCSSTIDQALDDVDAALRATREPRREQVRALVVGEVTPGFRYGFVTRPLVGSLEVRYALVTGVASTFVTPALLDRLGLTQPQLEALAMTTIATARDVDLLPVDGETAPIYRVRSADDPVALLLDDEHMKRFAARIGSTRLYAAVPARGTLYLTAARPGDGRALVALLARLQGREPRAGATGLLAYDTGAAAAQALTTAAAP